MNRPYVSLIIPCFNEGAIFENSVEKIINVLEKINHDWEIIFVDDKSEDDTKKKVERFVKNSKNIKAIYHKNNQGRGKAVTNGIGIAKGEICGYIDVDLEVSENYIPLFVQEIKKGDDLVVGRRFYESTIKSIIRVIISKVYALAINRILNLPLGDTEAGYKFFNRKNILPVLSKVKSVHWFWDTEICAQAYWQGLNISEIPVIYQRRNEKKSTVKLIPDIIDYIKNIYRLKSQVPK